MQINSAAWGINRINISLDSLDRGIFAKLSRRDVLPAVLGGIQAAKEAGLSVKINTVVLPENLQHLPDMVEWAHAQGFDISFIEIMPMGKTDVDRRDQYIPMQAAKDSLQSRFDLSPLLPSDTLGRPARYHFVSQTKGRIGFISPLSNNFCAGCDRIRLTCTGRIYMCLGQDAYIDLRETLRSGENLNTAIHSTLDYKPLSHDFAITDTPSVAQHMSVTGG